MKFTDKTDAQPMSTLKANKMKTDDENTQSGSDCQERLVRPFFARVWKEGKYIEKPVCCDPMSRAFRSGSDNEGYGAVAHAWADDPKSIGFGSDLPSIRFCPWCGADTHVFDWSTSPVLPPNGPDQREFKEGGAA